MLPISASSANVLPSASSSSIASTTGSTSSRRALSLTGTLRKAGHFVVGDSSLMSTVRVGNHVFQLYTYRGPAWCKVCGELLWGLARQGYKCTGTSSTQSGMRRWPGRSRDFPFRIRGVRIRGNRLQRRRSQQVHGQGHLSLRLPTGYTRAHSLVAVALTAGTCSSNTPVSARPAWALPTQAASCAWSKKRRPTCPMPSNCGAARARAGMPSSTEKTSTSIG